MKRLYISTTDKKICGVCGGLAEYFAADPTVIRLLWLTVTIITGIVPGILAYLAAAVIMPKPPEAV